MLSLAPDHYTSPGKRYVGKRIARPEDAMKLELIPWSESERPVERDLKRRMIEEGFEVFSWRDQPGADYQPHSHDCHETLWLLDGEIAFGVEGREYRLKPGDRLVLPKGTVHTAKAGPGGAAYLIGQRR